MIHCIFPAVGLFRILATENVFLSSPLWLINLGKTLWVAEHVLQKIYFTKYFTRTMKKQFSINYLDKQERMSSFSLAISNLSHSVFFFILMEKS